MSVENVKHVITLLGASLVHLFLKWNATQSLYSNAQESLSDRGEDSVTDAINVQYLATTRS
jgi:hypothetical protein